MALSFAQPKVYINTKDLIYLPTQACNEESL